MILVVSYPEDDHTSAVVARLRDDGHEVVLLDTGELGSTASLELGYSSRAPADMRLEYTADGLPGGVDLTRATAGWWRRVRGIRPDPLVADAAAFHFVLSESSEVLDGVIASLGLDWVNPPDADARAHHKPFQWAVAADLGFDLPHTIVTRDPSRARSFTAEHAATGVVTKAFLARSDAWRETHRLGASDLDRLDQVRFAPTILQEYVAGVDLRVTVVDDELFAAEIDATATSCPWDMRMVLDEAVVRPAVLPETVSQALLALMHRLRLVYGAIDLRRTPDGRYVFFEVNPAGLWSFAESLTGLPITDAVARALARRDRTAMRSTEHERVVA